MKIRSFIFIVKRSEAEIIFLSENVRIINEDGVSTVRSSNQYRRFSYTQIMKYNILID